MPIGRGDVPPEPAVAGALVTRTQYPVRPGR